MESVQNGVVDARRAPLRIVLSLALILVGMMGAFALSACGGDDSDDRSGDVDAIQGEWKTENDGISMTVVITDNEVKLPGGSSYEYSLDHEEGKMIMGSGETQGESEYELSDDGQTLTITEEVDGTPQVTTFNKVSDDTSAEPDVLEGVDTDTDSETGGADEGATSGTDSTDNSNVGTGADDTDGSTDGNSTAN